MTTTGLDCEGAVALMRTIDLDAAVSHAFRQPSDLVVLFAPRTIREPKDTC